MRSARWRISSRAGIYNPHRICRALNALTPDDIAIREVEIVADSFDARRDGRSRVYEYHILNRPTASPFYRNRAWYLHESLDLKRCAKLSRACSASMIFRPSKRQHATQSMRFERSTGLLWTSVGICWFTPIEATAFLRHMVRNIIGTLVEVGRGCARRNHSRNYWKRATEPKPARRRLRMDCFWWKSNIEWRINWS